MNSSFSAMLVEGTRNSLGRVNEVIDIVLHSKPRLVELYECMFHDDEWARMRAADAFEKVCREHPEWVEPYIDRIQKDLSQSTQPSIQWHIAQIYQQVRLTDRQKTKAIKWLKQLVSTTEVDWIVSVNAMKALVHFEHNGAVARPQVISLLKLQLGHKSKAVARKADKLLEGYS